MTSSTSVTTTRRLEDYIKVYENVLTADQCEILTLVFDMSKHTQKVENEVINFTELNLNQHHAPIIKNLVKVTQDTLTMYKGDVPETKYFPRNTLALEEFRIKRYNVGGEQFKQHVDVGNHNSARRFLSFLYYLNDVDDGGETQFDGLTIKPRCGSVLVFPPTWQYPHAGLPVRSGPKYIMSTYLHYQ